MKINMKDLIHYVIVFTVLAVTWTFYMSISGNFLPLTLALSFITFVGSDKLVHKILKV
jgi:hypothetical protein